MPIVSDLWAAQFQSTRPQGARLASFFVISTTSGFQSTRPQGARPATQGRVPQWPVVSIHAPARGATANGQLADEMVKVSIHAPARGATGCRVMPTVAPLPFQSTRPQGARLQVISLPADLGVSIHAPARGATFQDVISIYLRLFQSTRPQGARLWPLRKTTNLQLFQSTRPQGARLDGRFVLSNKQIKFQSTRPQGARLRLARQPAGRTGFNPRARKGRDPGGGRDHAPRSGFNPRARKGRDPFVAEDTFLQYLFQSTRPQGARPTQSHRDANAKAVSIHAPARGATTWFQAIHRPSRRFNPRARKGRDRRFLGE